MQQIHLAYSKHFFSKPGTYITHNANEMWVCCASSSLELLASSREEEQVAEVW